MGPRAHLEYLVERRRDRWTITFCGAAHGAFDSRLLALRQAVGDARHTAGLGHDITVLAREETGRVRRVWGVDGPPGRTRTAH
jgi:hypothetical protein